MGVHKRLYPKNELSSYKTGRTSFMVYDCMFSVGVFFIFIVITETVCKFGASYDVKFAVTYNVYSSHSNGGLEFQKS